MERTALHTAQSFREKNRLVLLAYTTRSKTVEQVRAKRVLQPVPVGPEPARHAAAGRLNVAMVGEARRSRVSNRK
jgi:hypothetical protein